MPPDLRAAIVQDAETSRVLMLAWMDDEALRLTRETGEAHFFSRSRGRLWRKGETSGQHARRRGAARRLRRRRDPPARPPGRAGLPHREPSPASRRGSGAASPSVPRRGRKARTWALSSPPGRPPPRARSGRRESRSRWPGAGESDERLVSEIADLWFHSYVLLAARGLDPAAVEDELARRAGER